MGRTAGGVDDFLIEGPHRSSRRAVIVQKRWLDVPLLDVLQHHLHESWGGARLTRNLPKAVKVPMLLHVLKDIVCHLDVGVRVAFEPVIIISVRWGN